jgi:hypothetical protein
MSNLRLHDLINLGLLFSILMVIVPAHTTGQEEVEGWAVVIEMNDFPDSYTDINVSFLNSESVVDVLMALGWARNNMRIWQDHIYPENLSTIFDWLDERADDNDLVLLYIFTHGSWMSRVLLWNEWVPERWLGLPSERKVLIVDTCNAGHFTSFLNGSGDGLSLSACAAGEVGWAGIEEEGLPILGSVWGYYLTNALTNSSADVNVDGWISVEEAYDFAVPLTGVYMKEQVYSVPEFLQMYHDIGIHPEILDRYPHPVIIDNSEEELILDLSFYVPETWLGLLLATLLLGLLGRNASPLGV